MRVVRVLVIVGLNLGLIMLVESDCFEDCIASCGTSIRCRLFCEGVCGKFSLSGYKHL